MQDFFWTDGGVYSWAIEQIKWCYKLSLKTTQRIVLRSPHLAGWRYQALWPERKRLTRWRPLERSLAGL
jgi:hypothetical protein